MDTPHAIQRQNISPLPLCHLPYLVVVLFPYGMPLIMKTLTAAISSLDGDKRLCDVCGVKSKSERTTYELVEGIQYPPASQIEGDVTLLLLMS